MNRQTTKAFQNLTRFEILNYKFQASWHYIFQQCDVQIFRVIRSSFKAYGS